MFKKMQEMAGQFQMMQKLMQDDNFKSFIGHPKVQELFKDADFKEIAKTKDFARIMAYPKFAVLMKDPELAAAMAKLNVKELLSQ